MVIRGDQRVAEDDREAVAARLREHFAAGRLTLDEFHGRLGAAFAATTRRDLDQATADLPHDGRVPTIAAGAGQARTSPGSSRQRPAWPGVRRHRRRLRSRLLLSFAALTALWLLIAYSLPHGGLLVAALLVLLGLMGLGVGLALGLVFLVRRAWRRAAWVEGGPLLIGLPWLARAAWAAGQVRTAARSGTTR